MYKQITRNIWINTSFVIYVFCYVCMCFSGHNNKLLTWGNQDFQRRTRVKATSWLFSISPCNQAQFNVTWSGWTMDEWTKTPSKECFDFIGRLCIHGVYNFVLCGRNRKVIWTKQCLSCQQVINTPKVYLQKYLYIIKIRH